MSEEPRHSSENAEPFPWLHRRSLSASVFFSGSLCGSADYAGNGNHYEVGAGWSQVAKSSGETYINLKIGAPEFGPNWVRARLVKLEQLGEDGATHIALWEPRDR